MSRGLQLAAVAALLFVATPVLAENDAETEALGPAPEQVHIELTGTTLTLTARFALDLDGPSTSEGSALTIPPTAMVTRATATVGSMRHPLQLADADAARTAFDDLVELAPSSNRKAMIVLSGTDQTLTLDTALPRRTHVLLDLRLEMPTCYFRDARYVELPVRWFDKLDVARPNVASDDIEGACAPIGRGFDDTKWLAFPTRELAKKPPGAGRIGTIAGRLELDERHLARVELDLSRELSDVPGDLHTAIVIDHSRSVMPGELEAERAIVASYLQHVPPQSRVQIIGYARTAKALLPDWMPAASSAPRVDREIRALAPRNGSNIDVAIAEAGRWLATANGTRRLIVFTDDRISSRIEAIEPVTFKRVLPDGTLVHVVSIFDGSGGLVRNDEVTLAPLALATDGLAVSGGPDDKHQVDATLLVRPISVDQIHISGPGWTRLDIEDTTCPVENADEVGLENMLGEGQACTWWGMGEAVSGPITIEGLIWGRRITRVVRPDPSQGVSLARILSATRAFESNSDETLQALVDRAAFAINAVWSMVGTWGGSGGYADSDGVGSLTSGTWSSNCCSDSIGDVGFGHGVAVPSLDLRKQLAPVVAKCSAGDAHFAITIETTVEEITDVTFEPISKVSPAMQHCLVEGVWDLSLSLANPQWRTSTRTEL